MTPFAVLIAALACTCSDTTPDTAPTEPEGPPPCTDCEGWNTWVDQLEAEFQSTGLCPTEPPTMVAGPDGTMVAAQPHVVDTSVASYTWAEYTARASTTTFDLVVREGANIGACDSFDENFPSSDVANVAESPELGGVGFAWFDVLNARVTTPTFMRSPPPNSDTEMENSAGSFHAFGVYFGVAEDVQDGNGKGVASIYGMPRTNGFDSSGVERIPTGSYAWACIQSVVTPDDFAVGPGSWTGSIFIHPAWWQTSDNTWYTDEGPPRDIFIRLGEMDCTVPEDASWAGDRVPAYCENWGSKCDGLDNDMDGDVDEGQPQPMVNYSEGMGPDLEALDNDGNGVADCMDDWDRDGEPNFSDEDVNDCCYDFDEGMCY